MNVHDVRALDLRGRARFAPEPLLRGRQREEVGADDLQRDVDVEVDVPRPPHGAHTPGRQWAQEAVLPRDELTLGNLHRRPAPCAWRICADAITPSCTEGSPGHAGTQRMGPATLTPGPTSFERRTPCRVPRGTDGADTGIMIGSWIIRTPRGRYVLRLHERGEWATVADRPERKAVWFFARMDLAASKPTAVAEAGLLYEILRGMPIDGAWVGEPRSLVERITDYLEAAVEEGRVTFERLPDPIEPRWEEAEDREAPFDPRPQGRHWLELEILDDVTLEPVAGMLVTLKLADGNVTQKTTDADGRIFVDGQPDEAWEILDVKAPVEVVGMAQLSSDREV